MTTKIPFTEYFFSVVKDQNIKRVKNYRLGKVWVRDSTRMDYFVGKGYSRDTWMVREEFLGPRLYRYSTEYNEFFSIELTNEDKKKLRETVKLFKLKNKQYKMEAKNALKAECDSIQWHP